MANIFERPEGIRIAGFFILAIVAISLLSRVLRSFELHATHVRLDTEALQFVTLNPARQLRIDHRVGSLEVGKDADFAIVDADINVQKTILGGRTIYEV